MFRLVLFTPLDLARNHLSDFVAVIMTAKQRGKHFWIFFAKSLSR